MGDRPTDTHTDTHRTNHTIVAHFVRGNYNERITIRAYLRFIVMYVLSDRTK